MNVVPGGCTRGNDRRAGCCQWMYRLWEGACRTRRRNPVRRRCWRRRDDRCGRGDGDRSGADKTRLGVQRTGVATQGTGGRGERLRGRAFRHRDACIDTRGRHGVGRCLERTSGRLRGGDQSPCPPSLGLPPRRSDVPWMGCDFNEDQTRPPSPLNGSREPASAWSMRTCVRDGGRATRGTVP